MPKKGGKKGGKQSALTEEERLVYMQQKAQAEDEMARRKEDMLTQFLKDKLQKEERNCAVNMHKLTEQWRAILRQTRAAELRSDIEIHSQTFERVLDHKDSVIKSLVSDLKEAEQQSSLAVRAHLRSLDRLSEIHKALLVALDLQRNTSLEELSSEYNTEREKVLMKHKQDTVYLGSITSAMEQRYTEIENEAQQDYQSTHDDIKNRNIEEKHALRMHLEGTVEKLWQQFQQAMCSYNEATEERQIAYKSLRAKDQHDAQEIEMQMKHLQKLQDSINMLRSQLSSSQKENETSAHSLRAARGEVTQKTSELKAKPSVAQVANRRALANLTVLSNNTTKRLQEIIARGEKILRKAELCRKLETEQEKVLPFYKSSLSPEELSHERTYTMEPPSEELARAMMDYIVLERFWQRYNKVLLERLCLERENEVLGQENQQLRILLKQYLDGTTVNNEILQKQNPLVMVSRPSLRDSPASGTKKQKSHTVIEAAHVVQYTHT